MRFRYFAAALLVLAGATAVDGTDLARLPRSIRREATYSGKPGYCLLVFGPKAEHRVWLVLDRDHLYVDRNGNGDLTEKGERVALGKWKPAKLHPAHSRERSIRAGDLHVGGLRHTELVVLQTKHRRKVDPAAEDAADWQRYTDEVWRQTGDGVTLLVSLELNPSCYGWFKAARGKRIPHCGRVEKCGPTPAAAPVLHFGGPLSFHLSDTELRRGRAEKLHMTLGTRGVGRDAFVTAGLDLGPDDPELDPVAEIEFPPRIPGKPPVVRKLRIDERC
jgi:hypothetical protein